VATFNEYTLIDGVVPANPGHQQWRVMVVCIARKPVHQRFGRVHERIVATFNEYARVATGAPLDRPGSART
jgi:hypothetical protein